MTRKENRGRKNSGGKGGKKVLVILGGILGSLGLMMTIGAIVHATYFKAKKVGIQAYGQLVEVFDGRMHVRSMGSGGDTVVLLPGMGVALPSADFAPLMRKLSEGRRAVCVEYFGVGFSSGTARQRNCENYMEETRAALMGAGFKPPYILMPHSISSVYAEYYAERHPEEVKAIISLDGTPTVHYEKLPAIVKFALPVAKFQEAIGLTSVAAVLATKRAYLLSLGYTEGEIDDMIAFSGFAINDTLLDQIANSTEFIRQAKELPYPAGLPYFKVIAKSTYETPNKALGMSPQDYQRLHLERIGASARFEVLDGSHFIYANNVDRIAAIVEEVAPRAGQ